MSAATATASDLALFGGTPAVPPAERQVQWPIVTDEDERAVLRSLLSGKLVSNAEREPEVPGLEREWSAYAAVEHCVAVSNGTAALQVALSALGIGPGDDVIVPALTFIASALGPLDAGARPVFADIDPVTFNLDARTLEAAVTPRTSAVVAVHLHGLPADMDGILRVARKRGLAVVEDAAQAYGAEYRGRHVGGIGDAGTFSLNATKNLPTCGEGGLITTDHAAVAEKARMMRQFGESMRGSKRTYVSHVPGSNHKINPIQAAFAREQLRRLPDYERRRQENVTRFLTLLQPLPGLTVPRRTADASHAWHILRFRLDPERAGLSGVSAPAFRRALHRVLRAEGVPVSRYQIMPLPAQEAFRRGATGTAPAAGVAHMSADFPNTCAVIDDSLTLQKRHLNPDAGPLLERYAEGFNKAWMHLDTIGHIARQWAKED